MSNYVRLVNDYEKKDYCENCFNSLKSYKIELNNQKIDCIINDNSSVILYTSSPKRILYSDIHRIILYPFSITGKRKFVFKTRTGDITVYSRSSKSMFKHLSKCFIAQLNK
jgi:hypothetical protein